MQFKLILHISVISLVLTSIPIPANASVKAVDSNNCKIDRNYPFEVAPTSVGFPIHPDRLTNKSEINILVVPFQLTDVPFTRSKDFNQNHFTNTENFISNLSRNKVKVTFTQYPGIFSPNKSSAQWADMIANMHINYGTNESLSTWGFIREAIVAIDALQDFTKIDSVVFLGPFGSSGGEALMTISESTGFFRPFNTNEKPINNSVLLPGLVDWFTLAHELIHNFGLTDLYDFTGKIPTLERNWSMFFNNSPTLFYWERWQLDWIGDSEVLCFDFRFDSTMEPQLVELNNLKSSTHKLVVFRTEQKKAFALEFREAVSVDGWDRVTSPSIIGYTIQSDRVGPIRVSVTDQSFENGIAQLEGVDIFIRSKSSTKVELGIWSSQFRDSLAAKTFMAYVPPTEKIPSVTLPPKIITCVKGKITKKISGVNPKCPKGYRKK